MASILVYTSPARGHLFPIMGVAIEGEAKAYSVTVLRFREMVNDELAGWPILVTW